VQLFKAAAGSMQARIQGVREATAEELEIGAEAVSLPEDWAPTATTAAIITRSALENILQVNFLGWS